MSRAVPKRKTPSGRRPVRAQRGVPSGRRTPAAALPTGRRTRLTAEERAAYFVPEASLSDKEQRYCRGVLHAAARNPVWCNKERAWKQTREGETCYNPWALLHKNIKGVGNPDCSAAYNFEGVLSEELVAYAFLRRIPVPGEDEPGFEPRGVDRKQLLYNIARHLCDPSKTRRGRGASSAFCDRYAPPATFGESDAEEQSPGKAYAPAARGRSRRASGRSRSRSRTGAGSRSPSRLRSRSPSPLAAAGPLTEGWPEYGAAAARATRRPYRYSAGTRAYGWGSPAAVAGRYAGWGDWSRESEGYVGGRGGTSRTRKRRTRAVQEGRTLW